MQQHPPALQSSPNPPPQLPFSPNSITTEQIQKCLDDNKNLILAILENQNLGKVTECAQYQAILQRNLMYLAAIADAQPPPSTPSQFPQNSNTQQANYGQQAQNPTLQQQQGAVQKLPFQLNALRTPDQQHQLIQLQAQQQFQGQAGANHGMHQIGQAGLSSSGSLMEGRGSKQNSLEANCGDVQLK